MMFNMKQARDCNTASKKPNTIYSVFVDDKLFISDDNHSYFESEMDARKAFFSSTMWKKISEYICYSQKFFDKVGDDAWREEFENKVLNNLNVNVSQYELKDECKPIWMV